ncbi:MAG: YwqJ-related putative deaminase, partial [Myxococcota bacterium]
VNSNSVQSEKSFLSPSHNFGAPGAHAEVFAVNQALHAIGPNALTDGQIANIAVSTLKLKENLLDSDNYMTGSSFTTCRNCEGVLGGRGMFIMTGTGGIGSEVPNN